MICQKLSPKSCMREKSHHQQVTQRGSHNKISRSTASYPDPPKTYLDSYQIIQVSIISVECLFCLLPMLHKALDVSVVVASNKGVKGCGRHLTFLKHHGHQREQGVPAQGNINNITGNIIIITGNTINITGNITGNFINITGNINITGSIINITENIINITGNIIGNITDTLQGTSTTSKGTSSKLKEYRHHHRNAINITGNTNITGKITSIKGNIINIAGTSPTPQGT